ncbi:MAG: ATP-binding protein [Pseudomonadota bacterium]
MKYRSIIGVVLVIVASALVGRIVATWTVERFVLPYQDRYAVRHYLPLAETLSERYGNSDDDDLARITEEVLRDYATDITVYDKAEDASSMWFGENREHGISFGPQGYYIAVTRKDGSALDIGPMSGSALIVNLDVIVTFCFQIVAVLLALFLLAQPIRRRMQSLLNVPVPGIGVNDDAGKDPLLKRLFDEHGELRTRVAELDEDTRRRLQNQRDFLHGVAHEFRGPLARLRFASHLDDESARPKIDQIIDEMEELVTEILQYSRFHHGLFEPENVTVLPIELAEEAVSRIKPLPPHLEISIDDGLKSLPVVVVDESLFIRCLLNLLLNACRFGRQRIDINGYFTDYQFVLNVDDDGPGIPPGKKDLIFEPFTRLDPSRSRESGGAGLGLAIVAGIVKRLRGSVEAGDSPLGGARFTISLPIEHTVETVRFDS